MSENWLSVKTAAKLIDASPMTVYRMIYAGELTGVPIGTGKKRPRVRIAESELQARMEAAATPRPSTPTPRPTLPPPRPRPPAGPAQPPRPAGPKGGDR